MESILGVIYPKGDLEAYKDWLKFSEIYVPKGK
jgi:hypothetical protein